MKWQPLHHTTKTTLAEPAQSTTQDPRLQEGPPRPISVMQAPVRAQMYRLPPMEFLPQNPQTMGNGVQPGLQPQNEEPTGLHQQNQQAQQDQDLQHPLHPDAPYLLAPRLPEYGPYDNGTGHLVPQYQPMPPIFWSVQQLPNLYQHPLPPIAAEQSHQVPFQRNQNHLRRFPQRPPQRQLHTSRPLNSRHPQATIRPSPPLSVEQMPQKAEQAPYKAPISGNTAHIGRLTRTARRMLRCGKVVSTLPDVLRDLIKKAPLYDGSKFDDIEMMVQTQVLRLTKALQTYMMALNAGLGKSKSGRHRLKEVQDTTYQRQGELFKFRDYVNETLPAPWPEPSMEATIPPELDGAAQKERICNHLDTLGGLGQEITQYAQRIIAELLTDFSEAPEEGNEDPKELEITESDLRPNEKELEEIQTATRTWKGTLRPWFVDRT